MLVPIFDLDGTLLDSDRALLDAFVALGVPAEDVTFGHVLGDECARLGISVDAYLDAYDEEAAQPFPGVPALLEALAPRRWAVCSNKATRSATGELVRLGWSPTVAHFTESFGGPKRLGPVLADLGVEPETAIFVGDTDHDRRCAAASGVRFALAGWNPRAVARPGDLRLDRPADLLGLVT